MQNICKEWAVNSDEYLSLDTKFGNLVEFAAWELYRKNSRNNHTDEQTDIAQRLRIAMIRAGAYYKRQTYIELCLSLCDKYAKDPFIKILIQSLQNLWDNKTRHGASRQKFGEHQEKLLFRLVKKIVPKEERPDRNASLVIDSKFTTYCKSIMWNDTKALGKQITRDKGVRNGMVSLSEFDYLQAV